MRPTGLVIFVVTYLLVSARRLSWLRLDRPAVTFLGAVACVVFGVLTPAQALGAVDGATLLLLFAVMGMGTFLALDGFFEQVEARLVGFAKTPAGLLGLVVWSSGILSAFITNDAVCVFAAPVVVRLVQRHQLPALPFLLALATGANTGSAATLIGNPQNMLCAVFGKLDFRHHLITVGPAALMGLAANHALLRFMFRRELDAEPLHGATPDPWPRRAMVTSSVLGATAVAYALGANLAWTAALGLVVLMLLHRRDTTELWPRIDWALLLFFAGLFVVVEGLARSGFPAQVFAAFPLAGAGDGATGWSRLAAIFLIGSNVVSNVPFILVVRDQMATLSNPRFGWELLAMTSTFAGNLTLLGSAANVIVAEAGREVGGLGFWSYLRVGLPLALVTTTIGVGWLLLVSH